MSYVFTFWIPCWDVRCDFHIKTMFGSPLPPVVCRRAHVLFILFVFVLFAYCSVQHLSTIWVTWWVSYKMQELLTLHENMCSPPDVFTTGCCSSFVFLCCVCLRPVSWVPKVASSYTLSILDCPFGFLSRLFFLVKFRLTWSHSTRNYIFLREPVSENTVHSGVWLVIFTSFHV